MPDLLVKLYELPPLEPALQRIRERGFEVRRAKVPERRIVVSWVAQHFGDAWASECETAFSRVPVSCFLAIQQQQIVGFACYDVTMKGFFGPTGVLPEYQGQGLGTALLLAALHALAAEGYAYAIIGGVGPVEFYQKTVGATLIEGSDPGIYRGLLKRSKGGGHGFVENPETLAPKD